MKLGDREIVPGNLYSKENSLYRGDELIADLTDVYKVYELLGNMFYIPSFRNAINLGSASNYYDIPVGQAFISQWSNWKTGPSKRSQEIGYKVTEDIAEIFEYGKLEINASPDGQRLNTMINGKSYKMSELGTGITQFFLVLASVTMSPSRPSFILIDEPEINLHASLQLDFLMRLAAYASHGVLFATHSIGLARASADYIYSVQRNADGQSEVTDYNATPRLSEFLGELSFSGYKELGFDKILLVEGSSEVKTIQQFLRWYKKEHQIVLLPMGGNQMINADAQQQLDEIRRISENISVLIDSERSAADDPLGPARQAFVDLCEKLHVDCCALERRATENYFPDHAVKQVKGSKYRALHPYELLCELPLGWGKSENWQIAQAMTQEDLEGTDLGEFLKFL